MGCILFVYSRTSIQAAKRNAQKHREADGGQISWRNESLRRHGVLEPPEEQGAVRQLLLGGRPKGSIAGAGADTGMEVNRGRDVRMGTTEEEERIRALAVKKGGRDGD